MAAAEAALDGVEQAVAAGELTPDEASAAANAIADATEVAIDEDLEAAVELEELVEGAVEETRDGA